MFWHYNGCFHYYHSFIVVCLICGVIFLISRCVKRFVSSGEIHWRRYPRRRVTFNRACGAVKRALNCMSLLIVFLITIVVVVVVVVSPKTCIHATEIKFVEGNRVAQAVVVDEVVCYYYYCCLLFFLLSFFFFFCNRKNIVVFTKPPTPKPVNGARPVAPPALPAHVVPVCFILLLFGLFCFVSKPYLIISWLEPFTRQMSILNLNASK
jgi:hypothetical protein